jgi:hypothetical protein
MGLEEFLKQGLATARDDDVVVADGIRQEVAGVLGAQP